MNKNLNDLLELIRFSEAVSVRIHEVDTEEEVLAALNEEFSKNHRAMIVMMKCVDDGKLRLCAASKASTMAQAVKKIMGIDVYALEIAAERSEILKRVLHAHETVVFNLADMLEELYADTPFLPLLRAAADNRTVVAVPVTLRHAQSYGLLSVSLPAFADEFVPSVGTLARHIAAAIERVRVQEMRRALERQHYETQKLEAIGLLAAGVAHDLNNVLGAIMGYAEMILMENEDERGEQKIPGLGHRVSTIIKAAVRASDLIGRLLTFARQGKSDNVPLDAHRAIKDVVALLEHSIDKRIEIVQRIDACRSTVCGDPAQIQNIVMNLAVNARDAMPEGGRMLFETANVELDKETIEKRGWDVAPGTYLRIDVADTGVGMDESVQQRIFEPFFTTKPPGKGSGLGLSSVYGAVLSHGGRIEVTSEPGKGSVFSVYLPCAASEAPHANESAAKARPVNGAGRILVVDDEKEIGTIVAEMLEDAGYRTEFFSDCGQALEHYRRHGRDIDLVLIDVMMPVMHGGDCFAEMKKINPAAKAVVMTGYAAHEAAAARAIEGVSAVLKKPFDCATLTRVVAQALGTAATPPPA